MSLANDLLFLNEEYWELEREKLKSEQKIKPNSKESGSHSNVNTVEIIQEREIIHNLEKKLSKLFKLILR